MNQQNKATGIANRMTFFWKKYIFLLVVFLVLSGALHLSSFRLFSETPSALSYYREAQNFLRHGDFLRAIDLYQKSLSKNPRYAKAHEGAARAYFALEDWPHAIEHYQAVLDLDKEHLAARTGLALVYLQINEWEKALQLLKYTQQKNPGDPENNHVFGVYHYKLGNLSLAKSYFQKAVRLSPSFLRSWLGIARIEYEEGSYQAAKHALARAKAIDPEHYEIQLLQGRIAMAVALKKEDQIERSHFYNLAREHFLAAANLNPSRPSLQLPLVLLDLIEGQIASAYERSQSLLAKRPRNIQLLNLSAWLAKKLNKKNIAIQRLEYALKLDPQDSLLRFDTEETLLSDSSRYPALLKSLSLYQLQRAKWHYRKRNYPLFRLSLERALLLRPFCRACSNLARSYALQTKDLSVYMRILRKQIIASPDDPRLRLRLERALAKNRKQLLYRYQKELFSQSLKNPETQILKLRTPNLLYVFDPQSPLELGYHPNAPALFSRALSAALRAPGPSQAVERHWRTRLEERMDLTSQNKLRLPFLYPYEASDLAHLSVMESRQGEKQLIRYIIAGNMQSSFRGLRVHLQIIQKRNASLVQQRSFAAAGRDALPTLIDRASKWIRRSLPVSGRILKKIGDEVLINLGRVDGIEKDRELMVRHLGEKRGFLIIKESDKFISRAAVKEGKVEDIDPGNQILLLAPQTQKK